ncbi:Protein of unknown function [Cotesia congregata]|uniref:Uncharacterized protein n=1 Tax=Cotesia congregata TaxID=51543 RepID=A0A8J2HQ35_COTCN|nr:Protein of unknown function [Cotesia congregata]
MIQGKNQLGIGVACSARRFSWRQSKVQSAAPVRQPRPSVLGARPDGVATPTGVSTPGGDLVIT